LARFRLLLLTLLAALQSPSALVYQSIFTYLTTLHQPVFGRMSPLALAHHLQTLHHFKVLALPRLLVD
jgi:hypothetical protein